MLSFFKKNIVVFCISLTVLYRSDGSFLKKICDRCVGGRESGEGDLEPSTLPGKCARNSLNFLLTEAFDFYGRALFQRRSRLFLRKSCISTEQARFFYKEQVIDNTEELDFHGRSSRQSTQRSQIFLYRTPLYFSKKDSTILRK